jgi:hypothetical protein
VGVLLLLIKLKFKTFYFLAIVEQFHRSPTGAGLLPDKELPFLFPIGA